eukprot:gene8619-1032_t
MGFLWYIIGFSFVYGDTLGGFIGSPGTYPVLLNVPNDGCFPGMHVPGLAYATFQMMFASITPLLMTGAFAERFLWKPYVIFIIVWEIIVYYPVAHWIWGDGWLANVGVLDYAGGIVIHTSAGASSLVAAIMVHPRIGFMDSHGHFEPSNIPIACVGGAFLWMGWFGFNAGTALSSTYIASSVIANTQIASTTCACVWLALAWYRGRPNVEDILNGAIAGLAGVTPAAGYIDTLSAMLLGVALGLGSFFSVELIKFRWHIDDALEVSSVHGTPGVIGALAIGFAAQPSNNPLITEKGLAFGGNGMLLFYQALAVGVVAVWSAFWTFIILKLIHYYMPLSTHHMSNKMDSDRVGLDELEHDCAAYGLHSHHWVSTAGDGSINGDEENGTSDVFSEMDRGNYRVIRGSINGSMTDRYMFERRASGTSAMLQAGQQSQTYFQDDNNPNQSDVGSATTGPSVRGWRSHSIRSEYAKVSTPLLAAVPTYQSKPYEFTRMQRSRTYSSSAMK